MRCQQTDHTGETAFRLGQCRPGILVRWLWRLGIKTFLTPPAPRATGSPCFGHGVLCVDHIASSAPNSLANQTGFGARVVVGLTVGLDCHDGISSNHGASGFAIRARTTQRGPREGSNRAHPHLASLAWRELYGLRPGARSWVRCLTRHPHRRARTVAGSARVRKRLPQFPLPSRTRKDDRSRFATLPSTVPCAIHRPLRSAVRIQLLPRRSPKEPQRAELPAVYAKARQDAESNRLRSPPPPSRR